MPTLNWEINLSDIVLVAGGIWAFVWMLIGQRDINRDVLRMLKGTDGGNGLVGDVRRLKQDMHESGGRVSKLSHWITNIRQDLAADGINTPDPE